MCTYTMIVYKAHVADALMKGTYVGAEFRGFSKREVIFIDFPNWEKWSSLTG